MNTKLPTTPVPDDFDEQVVIRAWMATLPQAEAPATFDGTVITRATSTSGWTPVFVVLGLAAVLSLWLGLRQPVVRVAHVPDVRNRPANLLHLPPAAVQEETRYPLSSSQHPGPVHDGIIAGE